MTTPPITSTTDEIIADLERLTSDSELTDEQWISGFTAGDFRALLAERADLKQQLVAAGITAENCEMFRKDAERYKWLRDQEAERGIAVLKISGWERAATCWATTFPDPESLDAAIDAAMRQ